MIHDAIVILSLALVIDLLMGEPPEKIHTTVWIGKFIERMENPVRRLIGNEKLAGGLLAVVSIALFSAPFALVPLLAPISWLLYIVVSAFFLKMTFAFRSMFKHVAPIMSSLRDNIGDSRVHLQKVVRRDTAGLDENLVASGAVETVAEGFVDGFISPIFFFLLLGLPGAFAYRVINTLDSTVAYMNERYIRFGWLSAWLDTIANYLPSRMAFPIFVSSSALLGMDWRSAIRIAKRDHAVTKSKNAGWPMSAMAGALNIRLEKAGSYALGDAKEVLGPAKIMDSFKIYAISAALVCLATVFAITLFGGYLYECFV